MRDAALGAVILAAGAGRRLGGVAKALLPAPGGGTFLERIAATARAAGTGEIAVVVGPPFGAEVAARATAIGATVVENPEPSRGMASSIALGFAALGGTACARAWLWPVDHPGVARETLDALAAALGDRDAARPVACTAHCLGWCRAPDLGRACDGRGGHPPLIARRLFAALVACADSPRGARDVLAAADVIDVIVADRACLRDVDTPEDLA